MGEVKELIIISPTEKIKEEEKLNSLG